MLIQDLPLVQSDPIYLFNKTIFKSYQMYNGSIFAASIVLNLLAFVLLPELLITTVVCSLYVGAASRNFKYM